jgi:zinc D-Ala-D-Ala carboxypeptidase
VHVVTVATWTNDGTRFPEAVHQVTCRRVAQSHGGHDRAPAAVRGALPDGVTVFDDAYPGFANLDADVLMALCEATMTAVNNGGTIYVTRGWHSPASQQQLLREAVTKYGSQEEAARWVATPTRPPMCHG